MVQNDFGGHLILVSSDWNPNIKARKAQTWKLPTHVMQNVLQSTLGHRAALNSVINSC